MKLKRILIISVIFIYITALQAYGDIMPYSPGYSKYTNNPYGYEIVLPDYLTLNEDIISVKSSFRSEQLVVDILYDSFYNTLDNKDIYNSYGNRGIKKNKEFTVTAEYPHSFKGTKAFITLYERRKLSDEKPDRNYYATIAFARTPKEVITVFIKSSSPIYIDYIMPSFKFIDKSGKLKEDKVFEPVKKEFDGKTQQFYDKYFVQNDTVSFGIFEPSYPIYEYRLEQLENMFNYSFPVVLTYNSFNLPFKTEMHNIKKAGKVVEYTLYATDIIDNTEKDITLDILEGKYDTYLDSLADSFNEYDYPVLLRISNEMNGAWVQYSAYHVGKDTDLFIQCWKYIYDKFKEKNVDNLIFVWNPNELSFPNYAYNHYLSYYPGNEYVDIVGITAYNTGNYYPGETWRSFSEAYDHFYYDYTSRFKHPMMITEFSCSTEGGNKGAWFEDMFKTITKYDRIKLAVLWNGQDYDTTKPDNPVSRNYRLDLDQSVIEAIRSSLQRFK